MNGIRTQRLFDRSSADWEADRGLLVTSQAHLESVLRDYARKTPRILELHDIEGTKLQLGIGGTYACAHIIEAENVPASWDARTQHVRAKDDVEFGLGGTATPVAPEFCLTLEEALNAARFFFKAAERDPALCWERSN
jgi:hypothetical protein